MGTICVKDRKGNEAKIDFSDGQTLMEVIRVAGIEVLLYMCGGCLPQGRWGHCCARVHRLCHSTVERHAPHAHEKKSSMPVGIQSFRTLNSAAIMFMLLQADLMIALGVRFDDRVTGKLEAFATRSRIVHIDIDPAEIHKNKHAHIPICAGAAQRGGPAAG